MSMERKDYHTKLLGLLTLYNPDPKEAVANIKSYLQDLDRLIVWDNSPLEANLSEQVLTALAGDADKMVWQGTGKNRCIAPAINHAWHYAQEHGFEMLLIMDQDSRWDDFATYRRQIEDYWEKGNKWVFTPYFIGSNFPAKNPPLQFLRIFINSGTVIPIEILTAVGGADERMPLDALDHDLAIRIQKKGYKIVCITTSTLRHTIGMPTFSSVLHLKTSNYNAWRTYSIARSHLINYRKHRDWLTFSEKKRIIKEYYLRRLVLIVLNEDDKWNRIRMMFKGIWDGLTMKIEK